MKAKKPLTDRGIATLGPAAHGKRKLHYDALCPGLAVRCTDTGAKTFVLVGRFGSKNPTARAIGRVGAISLADARKRGHEWLGQLAQGRDPASAPAEAEALTFRAICTDYLAREASGLRTVEWQRATLARLVFPSLGERPIEEIRRSDVVRLLDDISSRNGPVMANRTRSIIQRVMGWHASRSDTYNSVIVRGMCQAPEVPRERVLSDDELRALWHATASAGVFGQYVRFLLSTGARRDEARVMTWAEVRDGLWTLPAARNKTGQELVRPLPQAALAILAAQPKDGEFVFSRSGGDRPMGGMSQLKAALDYASGVKGVTVHDLRRSARTLMARAGVPNDHAEACLGHVLPGVQKIYNRHGYREEMRDAYERLAALVSEIVSSKN